MPTDPAPSLRDLLTGLRARVVEAMKPNENADGDWRAKPNGDGSWMICGPAYRSRPSRMIVAVVEVDGFTREQADANNRAIAELIVESYNALPAILSALAQAERDAALRPLLEEALDELCPHDSASPPLATKPWEDHVRSWCGDCNNYIRSEQGATLRSRVAAALKGE